MKDEIEFQVLDPRPIRFDPRITHIERHWWHKLLFWKKFIYLDDNFVITRKYMKLKDLERIYGIKT
jgi:hypothetical protein